MEKCRALGGKGMSKFLTAGKEMMGIAYGVIEDGTTFTTEVPNVLCGLPKMTTQDGPPHEYWTSKDESCGAWLAKVAIKRCCKKLSPPWLFR